MKSLFHTYPNVTRLVIGALLIAAALIGSGFIHIPFVPTGCLLVILITWLMLRSEGKDLSVLGFDLKPGHLFLIPFGVLLGMGAYLLSFYAGTRVRHDQIAVNHAVDWAGLLTQFWRILPTVAVQDFVVAGYCYIKLIQLTNKRVATLVFGLFFISLHDVWGGNVVNDLFLASTIFMGYLMFSTALLRSGSIWLVIGLHWGNNFSNSCLFTFSRVPTSWLYISGTPHNNLNVWQAIGLFIALSIDMVSVIITTRLIWRSNDRLQL
jgi:membrane protease YdiL (CAAX protease family)